MDSGTWEERVGNPRLIQLKQGLPPGPLGPTGYLDRLKKRPAGCKANLY